MLSKPILNDDTAFWHMEMMAWLISEFGPPITPPVPSLLHRLKPLHERRWDDSDQRSVFAWAEDEFGALRSDCQMIDFDVTLVANAPEARVMTYEAPVSGNLNSIAVEFDPRRCTEPGFFGVQALLKLAEIKASSRPRPDSVRPDDYSALTVLTVSYLGQGFALGATPRPLLEDIANSGKMTRGEYGGLVNTIAFTTALALACRRMQPDQAILSYGAGMTKAFAKKITASYRQMDKFAEEMKILKIMTSKGQHDPIFEAAPDAQTG